MTKNFADEEKYISVHGVDNAMEVAKVLLKNDYEVFIELDDCDVYCVHYATAKYKNFGNATFYRITEDDVYYLERKYSDETNAPCTEED